MQDKGLWLHIDQDRPAGSKQGTWGAQIGEIGWNSFHGFQSFHEKPNVSYVGTREKPMIQKLPAKK